MITPIEIRGYSFNKEMRGYNKEEVSNYLNTLSLEWEKLLEENKRLKNDLEKTQSNLDNLKKVESVLHKTLLQAEQTSKSTIENAKKDAELKVQEAKHKSNELLKDAFSKRDRIELEINELISRRNDILEQLRSFISSQKARLELFEKNEMKSFEPAREKNIPEDEASFFESSVDSGLESNIVNDIVEELE